MCVAASGHNASHWIEQFTVEELTRLLADKHLQKIAQKLAFCLKILYLCTWFNKRGHHAT